MKRIICILIAAILLFSGCGSIRSRITQANISDSVTPTPSTSLTNIEDNINGEDLNDDIKMTNEAEKQNINEENNNAVTEDSMDNIEETEKVVKTYDSEIPGDIVQNIQYDKYQVYKNYILILSEAVNIREKPTTKSKILKNLLRYEKVNLIAEVNGQYLEQYNSNTWYRVSWIEDDKAKCGYIFAKLGEVRKFQFDKMQQVINKLSMVVDSNTMAYVSNYKNNNGKAPLYKGKEIDVFGIRRYQSAPAYYAAKTTSEFRYIADGALVNIIGEEGSYYKITTINFKGEYYIPKKFVSMRNSMKRLEKVIVVDRKNQNEGVFQLVDKEWNIISYIYATTGENSEYKLPTDLGYYMVIEKRNKFLYLDDITKEVSGYAPYALRFSGGAYIHGVPVEYIKEDEELKDPGLTEYLFTIGTTPRSHKCVRNYTSHAKFLYDWAEIGKTAIVVIE